MFFNKRTKFEKQVDRLSQELDLHMEYLQQFGGGLTDLATEVKDLATGLIDVEADMENLYTLHSKVVGVLDRLQAEMDARSENHCKRKASKRK